MISKRTGPPHSRAWRVFDGTYSCFSMRAEHCDLPQLSSTLRHRLPRRHSLKQPLKRSFSIVCPLRQGRENKAENRPVSLYVEQEFGRVHDKAHAILTSSTTPSGELVQGALKACQLLAESLAEGAEPTPRENTPTSNLLDLEEQRKRNHESTSSLGTLASAMRQRAVHKLSKLAYSIITTPQVFITPELLSSYVRTQSVLERPETIPPIFILYASKPVPLAHSSPVHYRIPNPNKISSAVPLSVADTALDSAIERKNLLVCLDIINTSVCATPFHRLKLLKRALVPVSGLALAPAAAYTMASQWSLWQDTMDNQVARNVMFAGLLAYIGFTTTLGMVAITTANDHMNRVTWETGTPLRERWLREEERAMVDRVACAWGFQDLWRRGEEEGRDWQTLRDWIRMRRMVLDKVELMEGME